MSKMIQIRNVPDRVHRELKSRASLEGMSLSDYLLADLERQVARPTLREMVERLRQRKPVRTSESAADALRAERDDR